MVEPRLRLTKGVLNAELVARGEAEMAVQLAHEIRSVAGVDFVALPPEFQRGIVFSAGLAAAPHETAEAQAGAKRVDRLLVRTRRRADDRRPRGLEPASGK